MWVSSPGRREVNPFFVEHGGQLFIRVRIKWICFGRNSHEAPAILTCWGYAMRSYIINDPGKGILVAFMFTDWSSSFISLLPVGHITSGGVGTEYWFKAIDLSDVWFISSYCDTNSRNITDHSFCTSALCCFDMQAIVKLKYIELFTEPCIYCYTCMQHNTRIILFHLAQCIWKQIVMF